MGDQRTVCPTHVRYGTQHERERRGERLQSTGTHTHAMVALVTLAALACVAALQPPRGGGVDPGALVQRAPSAARKLDPPLLTAYIKKAATVPVLIRLFESQVRERSRARAA